MVQGRELAKRGKKSKGRRSVCLLDSGVEMAVFASASIFLAAGVGVVAGIFSGVLSGVPTRVLSRVGPRAASGVGQADLYIVAVWVNAEPVRKEMSMSREEFFFVAVFRRISGRERHPSFFY